MHFSGMKPCDKTFANYLYMSLNTQAACGPGEMSPQTREARCCVMLHVLLLLYFMIHVIFCARPEYM